MAAEALLKLLLERAGGPRESGYLLVLDGEGLENPPTKVVTSFGTYSVQRVASEIRLRHVLWNAKGAPVIAVIPSSLAGKLPPDLFRRARDQRVHALAKLDVLEHLLGMRVVGAESVALQNLALEYVGKLQEALSRRTVPTVLNRALLTELLVDVTAGEGTRSEDPSRLLARWLRSPPDWSATVRELIVEALPTLHGDEGRLLAWAVRGPAVREGLQALVVHGALLAVQADDPPRDAWGPLWDAVASSPNDMGSRIVRRTVVRLVEATLAHLGEAAAPFLTEAENIGRRKLSKTLMETSRVLPLAFQSRCHELAVKAAKGKPIGVDEIEWLRSHRAAGMGNAELLVLEAMGRLSRYLAAAAPPGGTLAERVRVYQQDGAFADLVTQELRRAMAGSGRHLGEARTLLERVRARRDADNLAFAKVLAAGYEAGLHDPGLVPLHRLWKRTVEPAWQQADAPLYLVVLDGCSYPVFLDLLHQLADHAAFPIGLRADAEGRAGTVPALAPLPTVTSHARGAIFLGELPNDPLVAETVFRDRDEARTDKARFKQNAALGGRSRELFLKGDLTDGGQRLLETLRDSRVAVVAAVFNAVDDQIGSSNTGAAVWLTPETITAFRPSLEAALRAGRRVLLTADHGHSPYVDSSLRVAEGATPRYLPLAEGATAPEGFLEIDLAGLGGPPGRRAFAWKTGAYLGGQQVGFHGGCSLEEMVVPLAWLAEGGLAADAPAWFEEDALPLVETVARVPETPTPAPPPRTQMDMFDASSRAARLPLPAELLASLAADEKTFLVLLEENGSLKSSEIAARMNKPPQRVNGWITLLRNKLHRAKVGLLSTEALPSGEILYRYRGGKP